MNYLSVCSGIEAATVAWHTLGWVPSAFAEIEPFPSAVLAQRWPGVTNLGDITKHETWPKLSIDILVGGTPCQGFSIAGERGGMDDPRSRLAFSFSAIAARYLPRWIVWENVPGVFSSGDGRDFPTFLRSLANVGYHCAWRVLDAQHFGVPQRRERVFVVGHLRDWRRAAAVLFERHSVQGNPAPSREAGKDVAPTISARTKGGGGLGTDFDCDEGLICDRDGIDNSITSKWAKGTGGPSGDECQNLVTHALTGEGFDASEDGSGRGTPLVAFSCKDNGRDCGEISPALRSMNHSGSHQNGGGQLAIAFSGRERGDDGRGYSRAPQITGDKVGSLETVKPWNVAGPSGVRRLTPRECERLQGFPDGHTDVIYRGKPACDGPRYKALGNSMAVPVMRWIGERIAAVNRFPLNRAESVVE